MVVHAYYPIGETRVQRQALALVDQGYQVDVICLRDRGEPRYEFVEGVGVHRLPARRHRGSGMATQMLEYLSFFLLAMAKITRLHFRHRYRTVQVHNLPDFLVFAAAPVRLLGASVVLDLHDLMPEFFAARTERAWSDPLVKLVRGQERLSCGFADQVITVSADWKQSLARRGVPKSKITVVMNNADPRFFTPRSVSPDGQQGFELVYHGTFAHRYGVDLIVEAVGLLRSEIPGLRAFLLGDGEYRSELAALIDRLDLAAVVEMSPSMLDVSELIPFLGTADVGVVPNRSNLFTDGLLPTKLMEYVAVGVPVVAARTPALESYFDDSMIGFFEPDNAQDLAKVILTLHGDRFRLSELSHHADSFNRTHSFASATAAYVACVEKAARV